MKKKSIVSAMLACALTIGMAGCGGSNASSSQPADPADAAGEENVLNVFTWANYFPDDILEEFTAQTGIKVNYATFESNEEMLMKLSSGGDYDVVLASDYIIDMARQQDLLWALDKEQIPNYANLNPAFQSKYYDPDNAYTVPYAAGVPLLIYNPALIGDVQITGFEDLWNPALQDSVVVMDDARNVIGLTLKTMGKSFNETDPAALEQAKEKLMQLKGNIRALDYSTPYNLMISGETSVGYMFTSQIITALNENPDLQVVFPKEGVGFGIDSCFVPAAAPHKQNAAAFLNFILEPERSAKITDEIFYLSCNQAATPYLKTMPIEIPSESIEKGEFIMNVDEDTAQLYNDIWTQFKQG